MRVSAIAAICFSIAAAAMAADGRASVRRHTIIPAQRLETALQALAQARDLQVVCRTDVVADVQSPGASGDLTEDEALTQLLRDTGLKYRYLNENAVTIVRASTSPSTSQEIDDGVPARAARVEVALEEVVVTGTHLRGVLNRTVPVIAYDREAIEDSGAGTVEDFLRSVPQTFSSTTPMTENSARPGKSTLTLGTAVDLRGAGVGATLVLLNGRRPVASGGGTFFDVASLPLGAIERIDIQTDGASAVYGSDAVAGVVNFVTRKAFEGVEAYARAGAAEGGRGERQGRLSAGTHWGSGGIVASAEYTRNTALQASDRDYIDVSGLRGPDASLFPDESKRGVVASFNQQLSEKLQATSDLLYSSREASVIDEGGGYHASRDQESVFVSTGLSYALGGTWHVDAFVDYGREESSNWDSRPTNRPGAWENKLLVTEGRASGALFGMPAGTVSGAVGALRREESVDSIIGNTAPALEREVSALYAEALVPFVSDRNRMSFVRRLELSVAGRYEDYSDFGGTFNPKVGLFWATNDHVAFRGTYSTAFRAPDQRDLASSPSLLFLPVPTSFLTVVPDPPQDPRLPVGTFAAATLSGANGSLQEETAKIWTGGIELTPQNVPGLSIKGSYFDIDYSDRVESRSFEIFAQPEFLSFVMVNPDPQTIAALLNSGAQIRNQLPFAPGPNDVQIFGDFTLRNVSSRRIRGVDFNGLYSFDTGFGALAVGLDASYVIDYALQISDLAPALEQVATLYNPVDFKSRATLAWTHRKMRGFVAVNHLGSYADLMGRAIDSWTTVDLTLSYDSAARSGLPGVQVSLNLQNLFDSEPPFVPTADGFNFDTANASPLGRFGSIAVTMRW